MAARRKICYVTTTDLIIQFFLLEHIRRASALYDVTVIVNTSDPELLARAGIDARLVPFLIEREISVWSDLKAFLLLYKLFRREKFDMVHSIAPKAGLLGILAGWLARVPVRIHTFQGEVWVTRTGIMRWFLKILDKLIAGKATSLLIVSNTERRFLIEQRVVSEKKTRVLANGSISGVNMDRFRPDAKQRKAIRTVFGVSDTAVLFLFLGRLKRDKGVLDLARAFAEICAEFGNAHLALVGPDEDGMHSAIEGLCKNCLSRVHFEGYTMNPEHYLMAADVLCLPSYREGFGMTIIEAAACEVPAVASRIYGIVDALEEGVTGLLHEPGDISGIARLLRRLASDTKEREMLGIAARARVKRYFLEDDVMRATQEYYAEVLHS